jgi:hypothetical protein
MQVIETLFDTDRHHIHLEITVKNSSGIEYSLDAILDTGAPATEFSDQFLSFTGFIDFPDQTIQIKPGFQSQKYEKIIMPEIKICGRVLNDFNVYVSQFDDSWGIDALIGLDFFRKFNVEIDYSRGSIKTKKFEMHI